MAAALAGNAVHLKDRFGEIGPTRATLMADLLARAVLASSNPHAMDGVADYIGGALLAFRASGHQD
jgi:hypothetical protein